MFETGERLRFSLFGRSHAPCVGGILEGLPAGFPIDTGMVAGEMGLRRPSAGIGTSRREPDEVVFVQGLRDGRTDGNPLLFEIRNSDADGSDYLRYADTPRPGHSDLPALLRFPDHDIRGGGWFSGRLTAPMVAAGAIAKQYIAQYGVSIAAFTKSIGDVIDREEREPEDLLSSRGFPTRACTAELDGRMRECIESVRSEGDSIGGMVECVITGLPIGFGGIWFEALDAELAKAMFGIPGCKGVEFGDGFWLRKMKGSESNDGYRMDGGRIVTESNHMGGIVGGMCDGAPVVVRTVFKATPSIARSQHTVSLSEEEDTDIEVSGRHDPCIVPRAVAAVEAMAALTVADQIMRGYRWNSTD